MNRVTDRSIERAVSTLLRVGVIVSGIVVLIGGLLYLARHGRETLNYQNFHGQPSSERIIPQIIEGAFHLRGRSIIQLGILLLIATPVTRVALSLVGFALERDRTFVVITAIVLVILLYSLIHGALAG
jgi:uncharacterized membrane protein